MKTARHVVLDDGTRRLCLPIGKEVLLADLLRGLQRRTLERIVAVGPGPTAGVNTPDALEAVWAELGRRRELGIP